MARRNLSYFTPGADGPLQAKLDEHDTALDTLETSSGGVSFAGLTEGALVKNESGAAANATAGTDYLASDVIERQTLGADAQEVTFTVTGNTDEQVEIEGIVLVGPSGSACTCKFNDDATPATYHGWSAEEGGSPTGNTTHLLRGVGDGVMTFKVWVTTKTLGSQPRGAVALFRTHRASDTYPKHGHAIARWGNTSSQVTSFKLRGDTATFFKAGSVFISRRRKFTA